jgi:hypothetical protein
VGWWSGGFVIAKLGKVDFYSTVSNCVVVRGVFDFVGYSTVVDEALDVAEIVSMAVGTGHPNFTT